MPQTLSQIKAILAGAGLHPRHRFGQNFLIDPNKLRQIIEAADVAPGEVVLEVGPGTGVLTEALLEAGARVVAVEIDRDLCAILRDRLGEHERFTLIEGDVLAGKHVVNAVAIESLDCEWKLIANLPYNIASPLLATCCIDHPAMQLAIVMVQREVADRLTATPADGKQYGPLSVIVQAMCEVSRIMTLPPGCFWPQPKIDSAVVKMTRRSTPLTDDPQALIALTQRLFQQRRKQVGSIIGRDAPLPAGVRYDMRPEQITVEQMIELASMIEQR